MVEQRLIMDVREACNTARTGKGQWTYGFANELLRRGTPVTLLTDRDPPPEWITASVKKISGRGWWWHLRVLWWLLRQSGSVYISPTSYIVPAFVPHSVRCIPVVHDLIAFMNEPHDRKAGFIERWTLPRIVRRCPQICTISESTKHDLLNRYPQLEPRQICPVFAGPMHPHPEKPHPEAKNILCIATLCPRKNQLRLIQAFASLPVDLRDAHRLILAGGRGWHDDEVVSAARDTPGVEWRGYITNAEYETLLKNCEVFALPSLYEGFGMQILDALQRGIPVLTSDRGSLRELAAGAAFIVNPEDTGSIAQGLERLLRDGALRSELAAKGRERAAVYSWRRTVDLFLGILDGQC